MFDEPEETPSEKSINPEDRAKEKFDEFRMHAEFAAAFEGTRKFEAQVLPTLDAELARDLQKRIAKLEKSRVSDGPLISESGMKDAAEILDLPATKSLSTNNYHIYRRPGEVMIVRWLAGEEVETFYQRMQAHFEAALNQFRQEERQTHEWKQDPATLKYLDALDKIEVKMSDRYLREIIKEHKVFVLSTQSADELDILHLTDYVMGTTAAEVVGRASAPPEDASESDRAWFFKLFAMRGVKGEVEQMCFFTYLQKTDEGW